MPTISAVTKTLRGMFVEKEDIGAEKYLMLPEILTLRSPSVVFFQVNAQNNYALVGSRGRKRLRRPAYDALVRHELQRYQKRT